MADPDKRTLIQLDIQLAELERDVFNRPPVDWGDFQTRQGRWQALTEFKTWVLEQIRKAEKDEEDDHD